MSGGEDLLSLRLCLSPAEFIDSDDPAIGEMAATVAGSAGSVVDKVRLLFAAVRDDIQYDPYVDYTNPEVFRASNVLSARRGYCVGKAALYAALCRAIGVPARLGLADVKNHLATPRLMAAVGGDLFAYHGYVEVRVEHRWFKASPTFNASLCARFSVPPLEFSGREDALLQAYNSNGRAFMNYVTDHGTFFDVPTKFLQAEMKRLYPVLCQPGGLGGRSMEVEVTRGSSSMPTSR